MGIFADDTKIFSIIRDICDMTKLQRDLNNMLEWNKCWKLNLNLSKCKVMHLGRNPGTTYTYYRKPGSTVELTMTDSEKDLSIWITSSLKPSLQCDKAATTDDRILGMFKRALTILLRELFVLFCRTYVFNTVFNFGAFILPVTLIN